MNYKLREDLLSTALYGASNYWYLLPDLAIHIAGTQGGFIEARVIEAVRKGVEIPVLDLEDPSEKLGEISLFNIKRGEQTLKEKNPDVYKRITTDNWDGFDADIWFQYVVMNEIIFG